MARVISKVSVLQLMGEEKVAVFEGHEKPLSEVLEAVDIYDTEGFTVELNGREIAEDEDPMCADRDTVTLVPAVDGGTC